MYTFNDPVNFYLIRSTKIGNLQKDYENTLDQLGTYEGIGINKTSNSKASISFSKSDIQATLEIAAQKKHSDVVTSSQMTLTCEKVDGVSVNLLRNIVRNLGFQIYNPTLGCFLVNDPNLLDLTTGTIDPVIMNIFMKMKVRPIFNFQNSLIYFVQGLNSKKIHLVNHHLLGHFLHKKTIDTKAIDFSTPVAKDIGRFVALFRRGLLFRDFYKANDKILNLAGFNENKVSKSVFIRPLFFKYNEEKQSFKQYNFNISLREKIRKGEGFNHYPKKFLDKLRIANNFLVAKIMRTINFEMDEKNTRIPSLNMCIYVDSQ